MIALFLGLVARAALTPAASAKTLVVGRDAPTVQAAVDRAAPADTVVLPEGDWPGPVQVDKALTLTSHGGVLTGHEGTTLRVAAPGVVIDGLKVRGSGTNLSGPDACIRLEPEAVGAVVRNSTLMRCLFGIWVHKTHSAQIVGDHVEGIGELYPSEKGNGIHVFNGEQVVVQHNVVVDARDGIYISNTTHSLIVGNTVSHLRYGIHYMYSYNNTLLNNVADHNIGGLALMESHGLTVVGNVARGNERRGILFRDVAFCTIKNNRVENNGEGLFFFSSVDNTIADNVIAHNQVGARIWAGTHRNKVEGNAFIANQQQILYVAASDDHWGSNYWSDYLGWDQDGDGRGDRPYRVGGLVSVLLDRYPQAVLLLSSPAMELLNWLEDRLPALRVPTIVDDYPLIAPTNP